MRHQPNVVSRKFDLKIFFKLQPDKFRGISALTKKFVSSLFFPVLGHLMGESIHDSLLQVGEVYGVSPPPAIPWRKRVEEEYRTDRLWFFFNS